MRWEMSWFDEAHHDISLNLDFYFYYNVPHFIWHMCWEMSWFDEAHHDISLSLDLHFYFPVNEFANIT